MKKIAIILLSILVSVTAHGEKKQNLKVLYVGGSSDYYEDYTPEKVAQRTESFENFLKKYFKEVTVVAGSEYKSEMSAGVDVTIFDGKLPELSPGKIRKGAEGKTEDYFLPARFTEDFSYPAILIADACETLGRSIGVKYDWKCLCLQNDAHSFNQEHPIFKGPFKTRLTIVEKPTPDAAYGYKVLYEGGAFPDKLPMWKVNETGAELGNNYRIGLVSSSEGFLDSPEAEVISGGVSEKSLDAVAIARHGNFFFWGFGMSPVYMTEEARVVFANAVVYTAGLKGQKIIARKYRQYVKTKDAVKENIAFTSDQAYADLLDQLKSYKQMCLKSQAASKEKQLRGEELTDDDYYNLETDFSNADKMSKEDFLMMTMWDDYEKYGHDIEGYHRYMRENEPYFYSVHDDLIVDEDAKSLGINNTDIKFLETAISMLEKGEKTEMAQRILDRYTLCTFETPGQWREWFDTYREKIFFTQAGGWKFMVNTFDPTVPGNDYTAKELYLQTRNLALPENDKNDPVVVNATLAILPAGKEYVIVKMNILNGYHTYGKLSADAVFIPTTITLELPEGYTQSRMKLPAGKPLNSKGDTQYTGTVSFVIPIDGTGKGTIKVKCRYQCCNRDMCFQPIEKEIDIPTVFE